MSLQIKVEGKELYEESTERFITIKPTVLTLEHSLIAISKWESKYHVPFLTEGDKTDEQLEYYFKCMTINPNVDPNVYKGLTYSQQKEILEYIHDPMTATWSSDNGKPVKGRSKHGDQVITSELIYYWMVALQIPSEYEKWHLNRLLTLIQVCNTYNQPPKKMSKNDIIRNNDAINAARRAALKSRG